MRYGVSFRLIIASLIGALFLTSCQSDSAQDFETTLNQVTNALCGKRIILLGENGSHADGATLAFKAALTQQLIKKCEISKIAFEASFYDFENISFMVDSGIEVEDTHIYSALGHLNNRNSEITSLVEILVPALDAKKVRLYGLDNQLSRRDTRYTLYTMPGELAAVLPAPRAEECEAIIKSRTTWQFLDNQFYDPRYRAKIDSCVDEIEGVIKSKDYKSPRRFTYLAMITNIKRALYNDFNDGMLKGSHRDESMYLNLKSILEANPEKSVIVWSTNTHIAKSEAGMRLYETKPNLGRLTFDNYGDEAFALGFSALSGETRRISGEVEAVPEKPIGSLERQVYTGKDNPEIYISPEELEAFQTGFGALYAHKPMSLDWSKSFDGIVIIKNETASKRVVRTF